MLVRVDRRRKAAGFVVIIAALAWLVSWVVPAAARVAPVGAATRANPRQGAFAGQVAIGSGRELYLRCAGRGSPTVLMDSGIHDSSDPWTLTDTTYPAPSSPSVFQGVARFTHVCIYDRPGTIRYTNPVALTTRSTPVPMPRHLPAMAADLHKLLMRAGLREPIVIVAHSMGGLIDRYFAQTYRREVIGMVLVDTFGTDIKRLFGPLWSRYAHLVNDPGTPLERQRGWETLDIDGAIRDVQQAKPLPRMPLAVISKTRQFGLLPGFPADVAKKLLEVWSTTQDLLVKLEPQTPHILATGSDHYVQLHDPDLVTSVIRLIFDRARAVERQRGQAGASPPAGRRSPARVLGDRSDHVRPVEPRESRRRADRPRDRYEGARARRRRSGDLPCAPVAAVLASPRTGRCPRGGGRGARARDARRARARGRSPGVPVIAAAGVAIAAGLIPDRSYGRREEPEH